MAPIFDFEHTYAQAVPQLSLRWSAARWPQPRLLVLNDGLADELGVDPAQLAGPDGVALLSGAVPEDLPTVAQAYAGHQFGGYSPRLGDGRALLLGEVIDRHGRRRDLHLKGSGRTPFARGGDGKAAVGPMLREYLVSEAMHALGIPTTRSLSVLATGEEVYRETVLPGAVLCRVAASHLRVGTFQYAAAGGDRDVLDALTRYAIERHYPDAAEADNPVLEFYRQVVTAQARLVARWMLVGFVHGVMNTDNMTISGETIDYGPCAFIDRFDPAAVFSSIDHGGRYAYQNQPVLAQWNLARLAETLLPLIHEDTDVAVELVTGVLGQFKDHYEDVWQDGFAAKLGLERYDQPLVQDLLALLHENQVDYTGFFRRLAAGTAAELFIDPVAFDDWERRRQQLIGRPAEAAAASMDAINPVYIPRNHAVEAALQAAEAGDLQPAERLLDVLRRPFEERPGNEEFAGPASAGAAPYVTFCGT